MPVGIGVTGMSGVNIVGVVELRSSPELPGVNWHRLSLFSRTLPAKMLYLTIRETFFIYRILFVTIIFVFFFLFFSLSLFFFLAWVRPPEGIFCKEQALL